VRSSSKSAASAISTMPRNPPRTLSPLIQIWVTDGWTYTKLCKAGCRCWDYRNNLICALAGSRCYWDSIQARLLSKPLNEK
jgi:hypothetical protein